MSGATTAVSGHKVSDNAHTAVFKSIKIPKRPTFSVCLPLAMSYVQKSRSERKYTSALWALREMLSG